MPLQNDNNLPFKAYQGFHSLELMNAIKSAWINNEPLIVLPPSFQDQKFINSISWPQNGVLGVLTSGTVSRKPRLVVYSKKNIESSLDAIDALFETSQIEKIFCYPQPSHTFGLTLGYLSAIRKDIPLIFHEGPYGKKSHQCWWDNHSSGLLTLGTPTHFYDLISFSKDKLDQVAESYSCIVGGAPVSKSLWLRLKNDLKIKKPSIGYGATEASPGLFHLPPGVEPDLDNEIGFPLSGVEISGVSSEGFIFSGNNLCLGIFEENVLNQKRQFKIKDYIEFITDSGRAKFIGRSDTIINRGGLKISPEVIEAKIYQELKLKTVAMGIYDKRLGQDLIIYIHGNKENNKFENIVSDPDISYPLSINKLLKDEMGMTLSLDNFYVDEMPLNENGKFNRHECHRRFLQNKLRSLEKVPVDYLTSYLPHRGAAIWIDFVYNVDKSDFIAEVGLEKSKNIFSEKKFNELACVELVAQAYGYGLAYKKLIESSKVEKATKTLIAEVKSAEFNLNTLLMNEIWENDQSKLRVQTRCTHDFQSLKIITGEVYFEQTCIATVNLKALVLID